MGVCRLCFKRIDGEEIFNADILEALDTFMPELNHSLVEQPVICEKCLENINITFTLLHCKVESDIKIQKQLDDLKVSQIDLRRCQEGENIPEMLNICRMCLKSIKEPGVCLYNTPDNTELELIIKMLAVCCIFLDLEVSPNPVMCSECLELVKTVYTFKTEFLKIEIRLQDHCHINNIRLPLSPLQLEEIIKLLNDKNCAATISSPVPNERVDEDDRNSDPDDEFVEEESPNTKLLEESDAEKNPHPLASCNKFTKHNSLASNSAPSELVKTALQLPSNDVLSNLKEHTHSLTLETGKATATKNKIFISLEDHSYAARPKHLIDRNLSRFSDEMKCYRKANAQLIELYLEVTCNESYLTNGYYQELQKRWLRLYPEWSPGGERLCNYAYHLILCNLVPKASAIKCKLRSSHFKSGIEQFPEIIEPTVENWLKFLDKSGYSEEIIKYATLASVYLFEINNKIWDSVCGILKDTWKTLYPYNHWKNIHHCALARYILRNNLFSEYMKNVMVVAVDLEAIKNATEVTAGDTQRSKPDHAVCLNVLPFILKDVESQLNENEEIVKMYLELSLDETCFDERCFANLESRYSSLFPGKRMSARAIITKARRMLRQNVFQDSFLAQIRMKIHSSDDYQKMHHDVPFAKASSCANNEEGCSILKKRKPYVRSNITTNNCQFSCK